MRYFNSINLQDAPIKNLVLEQLATDPSSPSQGELWYNTTGNLPKIMLNDRVMTFTDQYISSVSGSGVVAVSGGLNPTISLTSSAVSGQALLSRGSGVAPSFGALNLAGGVSFVSGVLPVANGGTGVSTGAANLFFGTPTGAAGAPGLRAIVVADLPTIPWSKIDGATTPITLSGYGISDAINVSQKGAASGVATLDSGGKILVSQLPSAIVGGMVYQGVWDASANTPSITSGSSSEVNKGYFYKVSSAGSTTVDGNSSWQIGDWIVSNGTAWDKIDNTDSVSSVAGRTGAITLAVSDISGAAPLLNPTFSGTVTATTFSGSGASLTDIPNSAFINSSITVGSTQISLGASTTTLAGLTSVTATTFVGALTGTATNSTNAGITNDVATSTAVYPTWVSANTGNLPVKTSSTKLSFIPTTGILTASGVVGSGAGLTAIPNSALTNNTITVGTTAISLGASATILAGLSSVTATTFVGSLTGTASSATNTAIINDVATATAVYPTWVSANTGNLPQKTSSTKLSFVPSTGTLSATSFSGAHSGSGAGLTAIPNSALTNSSITIGSTAITLGASSTTLAGLSSVASTSFIGSLTGNASTVTTNANLSGDVSSVGNVTTLATVATAGTYAKVTVNVKGLVTSGGSLAASDIPSLDFSKIVTGTVPVNQGGTGATTAAAARANLGAVGKSSDLIGDGSTTSITYTHGLGLASKNACTITVCIEATGEVIMPDIFIIDANSILLVYGPGLQPALDAHRVTVIG